MTERVTDGKLRVLAAYRYLADGTKIGVTDQAGNGYEYLGSLIYRHTPSGLELESTDFSGGRIDRTTTGYRVNYFVRDYLGSVRAIADERGQRIESMDYMPFGSRWNDPQRLVTDNRYRYNGKEWQPTGELNVLDYGARMYDPTLGRWFNPDPAMQFLNPYTFCGNDPINGIDMDGLWVDTEDGSFTDDPKEIKEFLEGKGLHGGMIISNDKPSVTTDSQNKQTNDEGGARNGHNLTKVMINGNWVEVPNVKFSFFTILFWKCYSTKAIHQFYIDEVTFAYLLSKGYLRENAAMKGDVYTTRLVFYGQDMDLALSFGEVEVQYTMEDGSKNFIFMKDFYDFNKGSRKWYFEIMTTVGRNFPGQPFHIYFPAPPKNMYY